MTNIIFFKPKSTPAQYRCGGNFDHEENQKTGGKKQNQAFFLNFGKIIIDIAKLCFGSLVLGVVIRGEIPQETLIMMGIIATAAGAIIGIFIVAVCEEK